MTRQAIRLICPFGLGFWESKLLNPWCVCRKIVLLASLVASPHAGAAEIEVSDLLGTDRKLITIKGDLQSSDADQFKRKAGFVQKAVVSFSSDGGSLNAGLEIGKSIRLKNFWSVVPAGVRCASACALAWLGGNQRYMGTNAQIGFHAAYRVADGQASESGVGNAVMGAYLANLGLSTGAVIYITQAAPAEMTWLSAAAAEKLGIEVTASDAYDQPKRIAEPGPTTPPNMIATPVAPLPSIPANPPPQGQPLQPRPAPPAGPTGGMILCESPGKRPVVLELNSKRMLNRTISCISGDFIADMTPCAPADGIGLSAPTGSADLVRVVSRWQETMGHSGGGTSHYNSSTEIYFSGAFYSGDQGAKDLWSFRVDKLTAQAVLKVKGQRDVAYLCKKAAPKL